MDNEIQLTYPTPSVAVITLNRPDKLNALTQDHYYRLGSLLRDIATQDAVVVTVLTGSGRFFSAGADVSISRSDSSRPSILSSFVARNLDITHTFALHPKILIAALNGPVVGLSAALVAHADFIYATPSTYLLTPFSSLGLVAEGGASRAFVNRMGAARAHEALLMSKRIGAGQLREAGFVNDVFEQGVFWEKVMAEVERLVDPDAANRDSVLGIKKLLLGGARKDAAGEANVQEVLMGLQRFVEGTPQKEFERLKRGEKRHKL